LSVNVLVLLLPPRQRLSRLTLRPRAEKVSEEKCPTGDTGRFIGYSEVIQFDGLSTCRRSDYHRIPPGKSATVYECVRSCLYAVPSERQLMKTALS
jgi:hypothetical protein